jgi:hypothetical protein
MNEDLPRSDPRRPYALLIVTIVSIGRALAATVGLFVVATASTAGGTGRSAPASTVVNGDNTVGRPADEQRRVRAEAAAAIAPRYGARAATRIRRDTVGIWVDGECLRQIATWDPF